MFGPPLRLLGGRGRAGRRLGCRPPARLGRQPRLPASWGRARRIRRSLRGACYDCFDVLFWLEGSFSRLRTSLLDLIGSLAWGWQPIVRLRPPFPEEVPRRVCGLPRCGLYSERGCMMRRSTAQLTSGVDRPACGLPRGLFLVLSISTLISWLGVVPAGAQPPWVSPPGMKSGASPMGQGLFYFSARERM